MANIEKRCGSCKFKDRKAFHHPCCDCSSEYDMWEPRVKPNGSKPIKVGIQWKCSSCNCFLAFEDELPQNNHPYCGWCGTKIDWRGVKYRGGDY